MLTSPPTPHRIQIQPSRSADAASTADIIAPVLGVSAQAITARLAAGKPFVSDAMSAMEAEQLMQVMQSFGLEAELLKGRATRPPSGPVRDERTSTVPGMPVALFQQALMNAKKSEPAPPTRPVSLPPARIHPSTPPKSSQPQRRTQDSLPPRNSAQQPKPARARPSLGGLHPPGQDPAEISPTNSVHRSHPPSARLHDLPKGAPRWMLALAVLCLAMFGWYLAGR